MHDAQNNPTSAFATGDGFPKDGPDEGQRCSVPKKSPSTRWLKGDDQTKARGYLLRPCEIEATACDREGPISLTDR
jgi:hypothetical protein